MIPQFSSRLYSTLKWVMKCRAPSCKQFSLNFLSFRSVLHLFCQVAASLSALALPRRTASYDQRAMLLAHNVNVMVATEQTKRNKRSLSHSGVLMMSTRLVCCTFIVYTSSCCCAVDSMCLPTYN